MNGFKMLWGLRHLLLSFLLLPPLSVLADDQSTLLTDNNGDGRVSVLAFGDSITYGVGDGVPQGAFVEEAPRTNGSLGYPERIERLISVPVENRGVPGESLSQDGINRIASEVQISTADVVVLLEGVNDSISRIDRGEYERLLQKAINVVRASGKAMVLGAPMVPCCNRAGREPFILSYVDAVRELALINQLAVADFNRAWSSTCRDPRECELYNLPEGLHPNKVGYDVMGEVALAALLGIDIFRQGGAAELEDMLSLPPGSVVVRPEEVVE